MAFLTLDSVNTQSSGTLLVSTGTAGKAFLVATSGTPTGADVAAISGSSVGGNGVEGVSTAPAPNFAGVAGFCNGGAGVVGLTRSGAPGIPGVAGLGHTIGVQGLLIGQGGAGQYLAAVAGEADSVSYDGLRVAPGTHLVGVSGYSDIDMGVGGGTDSGVGVVGDGGRSGVGIVAVGNDSNYALVTQGGFSGHGGGPAPGDVLIQGALIVTGSPKSAAVKVRDGSHRALYCVESPECWFEDFGRARLVRGRARVRIDRTFAEVVRTGDYHVFLSPEGLSHGLYVSRRTRDGFEVREQHRGTSTVRFSYRIVARRKDVDAPRFKRVKLPILPKRPRPPKLTRRLITVPTQSPELKKLLARMDGKKASGGRSGIRRSRTR